MLDEPPLVGACLFFSKQGNIYIVSNTLFRPIKFLFLKDSWFRILS